MREEGESDGVLDSYEHFVETPIFVSFVSKSGVQPFTVEQQALTVLVKSKKPAGSGTRGFPSPSLCLNDTFHIWGGKWEQFPCFGMICQRHVMFLVSLSIVLLFVSCHGPDLSEMSHPPWGCKGCYFSLFPIRPWKYARPVRS